MSNSDDFFSQNQSFSAESFGGVAPKKKSGLGCTKIALLLIVGSIGLCLFMCCCCLGVGYFYSRDPEGLASTWLVYAEMGNYEIARFSTCENSQARDFTQDLEDRNVVITSYITPSSSSENQAGAQVGVEENGREYTWDLTFYTEEGPLSFHCIDRIERQNR